MDHVSILDVILLTAGIAFNTTRKGLSTGYAGGNRGTNNHMEEQNIAQNTLAARGLFIRTS